MALQVASKGKDLFDMSKDIVWDQLQLAGQCDVYLRYLFQVLRFVLNLSFQ